MCLSAMSHNEVSCLFQDNIKKLDINISDMVGSFVNTVQGIYPFSLCLRAFESCPDMPVPFCHQGHLTIAIPHFRNHLSSQSNFFFLIKSATQDSGSLSAVRNPVKSLNHSQFELKIKAKE